METLDNIAESRKSRHRAGLEFFVGIAITLISWAYSALTSESNVYFGWGLLSVAFALIVKSIWDYFEGPVWLKSGAAVVATLVFAIMAGLSIRNATNPHFLLVYPGLIANDHQTRYYYVAAKRKPLYNLSVIIADELDVARTLTFRLDELNPRKDGLAELFHFQPKNVGHERLSIIVQSRDSNTIQSLAVETRAAAFFPSFLTSVKDTNSGKVVFECASEDYPSKTRGTRDCGNDIFTVEP